MGSVFASVSASVADAVERAARSVVLVSEGGRSGVSGTIWKDEIVVTAEHTIRGCQQLSLVLPNGEDSTGTLVGRDPSTDIAVLRMKGKASTAELAGPAKPRVGHLVLAVGRRPEGVVANHGIISEIGGEWRTWRGGRVSTYLRLDLTPFTGFSGGPLIDAEGRVMGINTSGPRRSVMTLPAETVDHVVEQLLANGRIERGFIGIALQPVPLRRPSGRESQLQKGLLTVMVEPGSPAEKAGLVVGDIVIAIGETPLSSTADLYPLLDSEQIGKTITLKVLRAGKAEAVSLVIGKRGENASAGES